MFLSISTQKTYSSKSIILVFLISPLLVIFEIINRSIKGDKGCQFCFTIFIGLLSVLAWVPRADVYRHAMTFYEMQGISFEQMMDRYFRGGDVILLWMQYYGGKIGVSFEIIRFCFILLAYLTAIHIYNKIVYRPVVAKDKTYYFWIIILSIPFITITYGLRYGLACVLTASVIITRFLFHIKSKWDYILLPLAFFIHFGVLFIILIIIGSIFIPNRCHKSIIFILFCCSILISLYAVEIISILPLGLYGDRMIAAYTIGEWASDNDTHNLIGSIPKYLKAITLYLYISIILFKIPYSKSTKILFALILLWGSMSSLYAISGRIAVEILIIGGIYIVRYIGRSKLILYLLVFSSILTTIINWRSYTISNISYIIAPVPVALSQSYDYLWLRTNLDSEGTLNIYKH